MPKPHIWLPFYGPRCFKCGKPIVRTTELKGRLWTMNGKPIHTACLLIHFPKSNKIDYRRVFTRQSETEKRIADEALKQKLSDQKENERVMEIAAESQEAAAAINPKTKLRK